MLLLQLNPKLHQTIHSVKRDAIKNDRNLAVNPLSQQESFAVKSFLGCASKSTRWRSKFMELVLTLF